MILVSFLPINYANQKFEKTFRNTLIPLLMAGMTSIHPTHARDKLNMKNTNYLYAI